MDAMVIDALKWFFLGLLSFLYIRNLFIVIKDALMVVFTNQDVGETPLTLVLRVAGVFIIPLGVVMGIYRMNTYQRKKER